ncbi:fimbrial biogenesis chaperone [Pseudomonas sp. RIT-To-2]|uniref:fimbrial biogenesis chaperone n=1 Tax=Pseudomonas sp. RIT-To-2 TaxID=3462541 RepID=UPI0024137BFA
MRIYFLLLGCLVACLSSAAADANVVLGGTRLIYPEGDREVTLSLANKGATPALVQSWMDDGHGDSTPENSAAPFLIMPPVTRIEAQASQTLRILFNGASLPQDHESLFWLNVLEIPPTSADARGKNNLLLAIQSRIKVFYRPRALAGSLHEAAQQLKWKMVKNGDRWQLVCTNSSPFHVSFATLVVAHSGSVLSDDSGAHMVAPGGRETFELKRASATASAPKEGEVRFDYINDYGALKTLTATVE